MLSQGTYNPSREGTNYFTAEEKTWEKTKTFLSAGKPLTLSHLNSLQNWSLSHTFRQGNAVADALARRAKLSFPFAIWLDSVPPDLIPFVNADLLPS